MRLSPKDGKLIHSVVGRVVDRISFSDIVDVWLFEYDGQVDLGTATTAEVAQTAWMKKPEISSCLIMVRERYFNTLAACTEVVNAAYEQTVGCEFKAHLEAIKDSDTVITVYDPDNPRCEREVAAVTVAELLNEQILTLDPKAIRI